MSASFCSLPFCCSANFQARTSRWKRGLFGTIARYINSSPAPNITGKRLPLSSAKAAAPTSAIQLYWRLKASFTKLICPCSSGGLWGSREPGDDILLDADAHVPGSGGTSQASEDVVLKFVELVSLLQAEVSWPVERNLDVLTNGS